MRNAQRNFTSHMFIMVRKDFCSATKADEALGFARGGIG